MEFSLERLVLEYDVLSSNSFFLSEFFFRGERLSSLVSSSWFPSSDCRDSISRLELDWLLRSRCNIVMFSITNWFSSGELLERISENDRFSDNYRSLKTSSLISGVRHLLRGVAVAWGASVSSLSLSDASMGSHCSTYLLYLQAKRFRNIIVANWHARQGYPMGPHESCFMHPGQIRRLGGCL